MKQFMIDAMTAMMPFMRPLFFIAVAAVVLGLVLALTGKASAARGMGTLAVLLGFFLVACEIAGRLLGFEPTILFAAPIDRVMYRNQWPFWVLGAGLMLVGVGIRRLGNASRSR